MSLSLHILICKVRAIAELTSRISVKINYSDVESLSRGLVRGKHSLKISSRYDYHHYSWSGTPGLDPECDSAHRRSFHKLGQLEARILKLQALPSSGVYSWPCISLETPGELSKKRQSQEVCRGLETGPGGVRAGRPLRRPDFHVSSANPHTR